MLFPHMQMHIRDAQFWQRTHKEIKRVPSSVSGTPKKAHESSKDSWIQNPGEIADHARKYLVQKNTDMISKNCTVYLFLFMYCSIHIFIVLESVCGVCLFFFKGATWQG